LTGLSDHAGFVKVRRSKSANPSCIWREDSRRAVQIDQRLERSRRNLRVTMVRLEDGVALLDTMCRDAAKIDFSYDKSDLLRYVSL